MTCNDVQSPIRKQLIRSFLFPFPENDFDSVFPREIFILLSEILQNPIRHRIMTSDDIETFFVKASKNCKTFVIRNLKFHKYYFGTCWCFLTPIRCLDKLDALCWNAKCPNSTFNIWLRFSSISNILFANSNSLSNLSNIVL